MSKKKKVEIRGVHVLAVGIVLLMLRLIFSTSELTGKMSLVFAWISLPLITIGFLWLIYDLFVNWSVGGSRL